MPAHRTAPVKITDDSSANLRHTERTPGGIVSHHQHPGRRIAVAAVFVIGLVAAACGSSGGGATTTAPSATTAAPGPTRSVTGTNTTVPLLGSSGPTSSAVTETTALTSTSPDSTTPDTTTADTTGGTTTTTEPGAVDENGIPIQESDPYGQQYLQVKGTNVYCPVGPAWNPDQSDPIEGTGEVFTDNAQAAVLDNGWGVTVDLNDENGGRDTWNQLASACYNESTECSTGQLARSSLG